MIAIHPIPFLLLSVGLHDTTKNAEQYIALNSRNSMNAFQSLLWSGNLMYLQILISVSCKQE